MERWREGCRQQYQAGPAVDPKVGGRGRRAAAGSSEVQHARWLELNAARRVAGRTPPWEPWEASTLQARPATSTCLLSPPPPAASGGGPHAAPALRGAARGGTPPLHPPAARRRGADRHAQQLPVRAGQGLGGVGWWLVQQRGGRPGWHWVSATLSPHSGTTAAGRVPLLSSPAPTSLDSPPPHPPAACNSTGRSWVWRWSATQTSCLPAQQRTCRRRSCAAAPACCSTEGPSSTASRCSRCRRRCRQARRQRRQRLLRRCQRRWG